MRRVCAPDMGQTGSSNPSPGAATFVWREGCVLQEHRGNTNRTPTETKERWQHFPEGLDLSAACRLVPDFPRICALPESVMSQNRRQAAAANTQFAICKGT
jgi:hypothetical protein